MRIDDAIRAPAADGHVDEGHLRDCDLCEQAYAPPSLEDGRCPACRNIGGEAEALAPEPLREEFRSVRVGTNRSYRVVYGKRLLKSNRLVVVDRETGEEVLRRKVGLLARLKGAFR